MAAGTRTAPDVTTAATTRLMSIFFVDISGDTWSEAISVPADATQAEMEALVDGIQASTHASIYQVDLESRWGGKQLMEAENATIGGKSTSVYDRLSMTAKHTLDPEKKDKRISIPAPLYDMFINNFADTTPDEPTYVSDEILPSNPLFVAVGSAFLAVLGANWNLVWARYHDRGDVNERVIL